MPSTDRARLPWQIGFYAMTVALGDSLEDARARLLPEDARALVGLAGGTGVEGRAARAKQLSAVLQLIAADLETLLIT